MSLFEEAIEEDEFFEADSGIQAAAELPLARDNPFLFGHDRQIELISKLYAANRMPHGIILAGPRSVGKGTFAWHLARAIFADSANAADDGGLFGPAPAQESTGLNFRLPADHEIFRKLSAGGHPDFRFVEREYDESKGRLFTVLKIDQIRDIPKFLQNKPSEENGWRIVIIDDADTMNEASQNALLKTLEEPPPRTILMLVTSRLASLLPTIRSRCRVFHFDALVQNDIERVFSAYGLSLPASQKELLFMYARGSVAAINELLEAEKLAFLQEIWSFMAMRGKPDYGLIHQLGERIGRAENEEQYTFFETIISFTYQALLSTLARGEALPRPMQDAGLATLAEGHNQLTMLAKYEEVQGLLNDIRLATLDRRAGVLQIFERIFN
ncbi:MAG: AAA family ATPase [Alphaproteobacteria bacterium]|nr:AAA family ATPase [Alphaproteobacteria bacterium]